MASKTINQTLHKIMVLKLTVIFWIGFNLLASANTRATPDQVRLSYVQYSILLYNQKYNRLPHSWNELKKTEESAKYVKLIENHKAAGSFNDFIERFRFIPAGTEIRIREGRERVVAMATRSMVRGWGAEDNTILRLFVVQNQDGDIITSQTTEDRLAALFKLAGFDLSDYTGVDGNWEPEAGRVNSASDVKKTDQGMKPGHVPTTSPKKNSGNLTTKEKGNAQDGKNRYWPLWIVAGIVLIVSLTKLAMRRVKIS